MKDNRKKKRIIIGLLLLFLLLRLTRKSQVTERIINPGGTTGGGTSGGASVNTGSGSGGNALGVGVSSKSGNSVIKPKKPAFETLSPYKPTVSTGNGTGVINKPKGSITVPPTLSGGKPVKPKPVIPVPKSKPTPPVEEPPVVAHPPAVEPPVEKPPVSKFPINPATGRPVLPEGSTSKVLFMNDELVVSFSYDPDDDPLRPYSYRFENLSKVCSNTIYCDYLDPTNTVPRQITRFNTEKLRNFYVQSTCKTNVLVINGVDAKEMPADTPNPYL